LAPFQRAQVSPGKPSLKDASGGWFREILRALHGSSGVDHRIRSANAFVEIDEFAQIRPRIDPADRRKSVAAGGAIMGFRLLDWTKVNVRQIDGAD
jgi:hypothetical protein